MSNAPAAPVPSRVKRPPKRSAGRVALIVAGAALTGLVGTTIVYYLIGSLLYGHRSSWSVGQGEGFRVFLVSMGAAPFAAIYWGILAARFQVQRAGARSWWIALAVYVVVGFVLHIAADPGP